MILIMEVTIIVCLFMEECIRISAMFLLNVTDTLYSYFELE